MEDGIKKIIKGEDKKNPFTDRQIAENLGLKREQVTILRHQELIGNSRERRKPHLYEAMKRILERTPWLSETDIADKLKSQGFDISRFTVRQYRKESGEQPAVKEGMKKCLEPQSQVPGSSGHSKKNIVSTNAEGAFSHIIGHKGSLRTIIESAKAAILYPPKGLHTLILGEPGVGKSDLAEAMHSYAQHVKTVSEEIPFIAFNCADYANNPQLLMGQLFGYVKGAFSGAEANKEGLVEKAHQGIFFLDEVHRLPPEGQELLFYLMDKGKFRRLGETDSLRTISVMIIAATTESPESSLLVAFRRRIPMVIDIPALSVRPLTERIGLITEFFHKETRRINVPIQVAAEVIRALLLYTCPGNIGQLLSDIQVACAKSFLKYIINQTDCMEVSISDLHSHVRAGLLKMQNRDEIEKLTNGKLIVYPDSISIPKLAKEDIYTLPAEIYRYIEQRYQELQNEGMNDDVINYIIGGELEIKFKKMINKIGLNARPSSKEDLIKVIGVEVVLLAEKMLKIAERKMKVNGDSLLYCLAIHIKTTLDRMREGKVIINPRLKKIKEEYVEEYRVAKELVLLVQETMNVIFPEDEVGFIALYLSTLTNKDEKVEGRVGIVLISHGHVAIGMSEVANRLLGTTHAKGVEMSLDESPESALNRAVETVIHADEGKGVLLLVDMGSLVTFGELITQRTGIRTRVITRVDTVMVIDTVRKAILPGVTLDELADTIDEGAKYSTRLSIEDDKKKVSKTRVILTVCITGQGSAIKIKELIENLIPTIKETIEIIPLAVLSPNINKVIWNISKTREVIAVVGTVKPTIEGINFIPIEDFIKGSGLRQIKALLMNPSEIQDLRYLTDRNEDEVGLLEVINPELIVVNSNMNTKEAVIKELGLLLFEHCYVSQDFIKAVLEREQMGLTFIGNKTATPHADPSYTVKPGIAIARLQKSIDWNGHPVTMVYLLAVTQSYQNVIEDLYKLTISEKFINSLENIQNSQEMFKIIKTHLQ